MSLRYILQICTVWNNDKRMIILALIYNTKFCVILQIQGERRMGTVRRWEYAKGTPREKYRALSASEV